VIHGQTGGFVHFVLKGQMRHVREFERNAALYGKWLEEHKEMDTSWKRNLFDPPSPPLLFPVVTSRTHLPLLA
jgi:hypothetical protein